MRANRLPPCSGPFICINQKYASQNPLARALNRRFLRALVRMAALVAPRRVLDVGCGEGIPLAAIERVRALSLCIGVDVELDLAHAARKNTTHSSVCLGNAYVLPFEDRTFDLVMCCEVLEHLQSPERALVEIGRASRGFCLFSVPHEPIWRILNMARGSYIRRLGNTNGHINNWTRSQFLAIVGAHFRIRRVRQALPWTIILCDAR